MGFRIVLIGWLLLLICSCAQVGTLSGGEKDYFAPTPVVLVPAQNTTRFTGQQVQLRFNEYVELVNPQQNVFFVPNDAKPEVHLVNKTLHISWKEQLKPNTTYSIYLNNVVRDITEGNDSLMTYVFSTGDHIDSISYQTQVRDAWTNEPVKNVLVGLFTPDDSIKPLYFSRSDFAGDVSISNLKSGTYSVKAYPDEDGDLKMNKGESRGFREGALTLDSSLVDSSGIRLYTPSTGEPVVLSHKFLAPGTFLIETSEDVKDGIAIKLNGAAVPESDIRFSDKKLQFFSAVDSLTNAQITLSGKLSDTLTLFLSSRDKSTKCQLKAALATVGPHQELAFELNDKLSSLDTSLIIAMNMRDSSIIRDVRYSFSNNRILAELNRSGLEKLQFTFQKGALSTWNQKDHPAYTIPLELSSEKQYGTLVVRGWASTAPLFLLLKSGNDASYTIPLTGTEPVKVNELFSPGEYRVRVVEDLNHNGQWDAGDVHLSIQPERVYDFNPVKIRANWEVELTMDPESNE